MSNLKSMAREELLAHGKANPDALDAIWEEMARRDNESDAAAVKVSLNIGAGLTITTGVWGQMANIERNLAMAIFCNDDNLVAVATEAKKLLGMSKKATEAAVAERKAAKEMNEEKRAGRLAKTINRVKANPEYAAKLKAALASDE